MADHTTQHDALQEIALAKIVVADGFNPRGAVVEDDALGELAQTIGERGMVQPLRVRATDTGDYALIAGERRYRAAVLAGLTEVRPPRRPRVRAAASPCVGALAGQISLELGERAEDVEDQPGRPGWWYRSAHASCEAPPLFAKPPG